jgi:hypothetical protein
MSSIVGLMKSLPAILSLLLELKKLWDEYLNNEQKKDHLVKLEAAFKDARLTKDTTALTTLVNSIVTAQ